MNTVIVRRSGIKLSVKEVAAQNKPLLMKVDDLKENILQLSEEIQAERIEIIKMKIHAEKEEEAKQ